LRNQHIDLGGVHPDQVGDDTTSLEMESMMRRPVMTSFRKAARPSPTFLQRNVLGLRR
jgi:hypothetical protein